MDTDLIEALQAARDLIAEHSDIRALVLECTDLSPYTARIQSDLKLPVFDLTILAQMAHSVSARGTYSGIMSWD
ncbi:hypothetical protein SAMN05444358_11024 [Ruegeria halocynthiae]|uniref:Aspartate racemase n=1 Tax=Ruegeria halocynthiae TaxID=985054 RepID=A0A1H3E2B5_9RHOB|nr:hypothetical protein [Ruegeria halocynthiae]SDX72777.1 hypothetical protein SAMN05444358_11024 [Ruegeria halocynthiae]